MASDWAWPRPETDRHTFEFCPGREERPAAAITEAVTWFSDVADSDLEPIEDVVDPDWLRTVFAEWPESTGTDRSTDAGESEPPSIAFDYGGCLVTVEPRRFTIEPRAETRSPGSMEAAHD